MAGEWQENEGERSKAGSAMEGLASQEPLRASHETYLFKHRCASLQNRGCDGQTLVKLFTTPEIIGYPVENQAELEADPCLAYGGPELLEK